MRGDLRILLPQAAGGRVARVGERLLSVGLGGGVQGLEAGLRHVAFAAQLQGRRKVADGGQGLVAQAQRHVLDGAHVGGDVLARGAVAARGGAHEAAVLVGERNRGAVDLQLAHERRNAAEELLDAGEPFVELACAHGVVERVHAPLVHDGRELLADVAADALGGACRVDELGMRRLEGAQLVHERVECGVAYGRRVLGVIQVGVVLDLAAQRVDARRGIARGSGEVGFVEKGFLPSVAVSHERTAFQSLCLDMCRTSDCAGRIGARRPPRRPRPSRHASRMWKFRIRILARPHARKVLLRCLITRAAKFDNRLRDGIDDVGGDDADIAEALRRRNPGFRMQARCKHASVHST